LTIVASVVYAPLSLSLIISLFAKKTKLVKSNGPWHIEPSLDSVQGSRTGMKIERLLPLEAFAARLAAERLLSSVGSNVADDAVRVRGAEAAQLAEVHPHAGVGQTPPPYVAPRAPQRHRLQQGRSFDWFSH
jgi:hypothetical protein